MKNIFALFCLIIIANLNYAQIYDMDSISGGSYMIKNDPIIDSLVQVSVKAKCDESNLQPKRTVIDPCTKNPKVMGYKIQVMYTKDRNAATRVQSEFSRAFPSLVPEMVWTRPDYRVMAGDFFTKRSAAMDLAAVKRKYPGAFLVQWRVWCRKAK